MALLIDNKDRLDKFRYEMKVPMDQPQAMMLKHRLYEHGLYPTSPFPPRRVQSVYFDTYEFDDYLDNTSGIADRIKTRIRWYNDDLSKLTLEHKVKRNKASYKESLKLDNPELIHPSDLKAIRPLLQKAGALTAIAGQQPTLQVEYDREYFMLRDELRMTIDTNQIFTRLYPSPAKTSQASPVYCVAEFKYPAPMRAKMQAFMRDMPFRVFRHSKYVIGMDVTAQ